MRCLLAIFSITRTYHNGISKFCEPARRSQADAAIGACHQYFFSFDTPFLRYCFFVHATA